MTERFDALDAKVDAKTDKTQVEQLQNSVDGIAKDTEDIKLEMVVSKRQHDRHEEWIERASSKLKIDYDPAA